MQVIDDLSVILILAVFLVLIMPLSYIGGKIAVKGWNYESKDPSLQASKYRELHSQLVGGPVYILWFIVSIYFLDSLLWLVLGYIALFVGISVGGALGAKDLEDIPLDILLYNYKIRKKERFTHNLLPQKKEIQFSESLPNKKRGRRYSYWRGYGRYSWSWLRKIKELVPSKKSLYLEMKNYEKVEGSFGNNISCSWSLPVVLVLQNSQYATLTYNIISKSPFSLWTNNVVQCIGLCTLQILKLRFAWYDYFDWASHQVPLSVKAVLFQRSISRRLGSTNTWVSVFNLFHGWDMLNY